MYRLRYVAVAPVAGTVGAAVALLLAPDTGRNTRRRIARRASHEREQIARRGRRLASEAGEYLEEKVKDSRRAMEGVKGEVTDRFEDGKKRVARIVGSWARQAPLGRPDVTDV